MKKLYIVVPCHNEEPILRDSTAQLSAVLDELCQCQLISDESRLLYVDDGSTDGTWTVMRQLQKEYRRLTAIRLSHNVGQQNALFAGMETACDHADMVITIDADLQDDISAMRTMVEKYYEGCDVVYGVRAERKTDSWTKRNNAQMFYRIVRRMGIESVYSHADYRLMSQRAVKALLQYHEKDIYLRGVVPQLGFKHDCVYYNRMERTAGTTSYSLSRQMSLAMTGITSFSSRPIYIVTVLGIIFLFIALGILIWVITMLLCHRTVAGWTSLMLSVWFCSGVLLVCLGVIGEYIGKIYLEVKDRPRYHIMDTV